MATILKSMRAWLAVTLLVLGYWDNLASADDRPSYSIVEGRHPVYSYADLDLTPGWLRIRYRRTNPNTGTTGLISFDDGPRYFLTLPDEVVEPEIEYFIKHKVWTERVLLEKLYYGLLFGRSDLPPSYERNSHELKELERAHGWDRIEDRDSDYCTWEGIECNYDGKVQEIRLGGFSLTGTLPEELCQLTELQHLDLKENSLRGPIPYTYGRMSNLRFMNFAMNHLSGTVTPTLAKLTSLEHIWLSSNRFTGTLPENFFDKWNRVELVDFSSNRFTGNIPPGLSIDKPQLANIFLEENQFTGTLPDDAIDLQELRVIDVGLNNLTGTVSTSWWSLPLLRDFNVFSNQLSGMIPTDILQLTNLEALILSRNKFAGIIPTGDDRIPGKEPPRNGPIIGGKWSDLSNLDTLMFNDNQLSGPIPPDMLYGLREKLSILDIANNELTGPIPEEIGQMSVLRLLSAQKNRLTGTLPLEMNRMDPNLDLNLTSNLLVGTIPKLFCGGGAASQNMLYRQFGCDAILCPAGTFHPHGAATLKSGCRPCPPNRKDQQHRPPLNRVLGRTSCPGVSFVEGDLNGDGILSPREVLRLLYTYTIGQNWGSQFQAWADPRVGECDLNGVVCVNGEVAKIDLTDAAMCSNGARKPGPIEQCRGLPSTLSLLTNLEVLTLNRRQFLRGTIPTELGLVTRLKFIDMSNCPGMTGPLPSELGKLTHMKYMNLAGSRLNGTVPEELYQLTDMEKLHLSMNILEGTISPNIVNLQKLKELMWSRTAVTGTIPEAIGELTTLENLELYGNAFTGTIPGSLGNCTNLKRIDLFNNKLTGTIPDELTTLQSLQILHLKLNQLTGTISPMFGQLPFLSWFDVSSNRLHGTIPETFGHSRSIKDFRLGGNMIYDPIPKSLCENTNVNGGLTRMYGCDGVICPLGTYSDPGHATHSEGCKPCPEGQTNMYLGSSSCETFSEADILSIFFDVMGGQNWNPHEHKNWKNMDVSVCEWGGIRCDKDGEIESIRFPLMGFDDPDQIMDE